MREIRCIGCGQINRIPRYSIYRIPRCAKCDLKLHEPPLITRARTVYIHRGRVLLVLGVIAGSAAAIIIGNIEAPTPPASNAPTATPPPDLSRLAVAPVPETCANQPENGALLYPGTFDYGPHRFEIDNGTEGIAVIKVRNDVTGLVVVSFLVDPGKSAVYFLPDGVYRTQYAIGKALGKDCRSLVKIDAADEFPGSDTMSTRLVAPGLISHDKLSYTLYPVPGGTVIPHAISVEEFNAP